MLGNGKESCGGGEAAQGEAQKMDFEPPSRIMKLAATARYSSRVFMATASVPDEFL